MSSKMSSLASTWFLPKTWATWRLGWTQISTPRLILMPSRIFGFWFKARIKIKWSVGIKKRISQEAQDLSFLLPGFALLEQEIGKDSSHTSWQTSLQLFIFLILLDRLKVEDVDDVEPSYTNNPSEVSLRSFETFLVRFAKCQCQQLRLNIGYILYTGWTRNRYVEKPLLYTQ